MKVYYKITLNDGWIVVLREMVNRVTIRRDPNTYETLTPYDTTVVPSVEVNYYTQAKEYYTTIGELLDRQMQLNNPVVTLKRVVEGDLPEFVTLTTDGSTSVLRLTNDIEYYRDAGEWGVDVVVSDLGFLRASSTEPHLHGVILHPTTREHYLTSNEGYVPDHI